MVSKWAVLVSSSAEYQLDSMLSLFLSRRHHFYPLPGFRGHKRTNPKRTMNNLRIANIWCPRNSGWYCDRWYSRFLSRLSNCRSLMVKMPPSCLYQFENAPELKICKCFRAWGWVNWKFNVYLGTIQWDFQYLECAWLLCWNFTSRANFISSIDCACQNLKKLTTR